MWLGVEGERRKEESLLASYGPGLMLSMVLSTPYQRCLGQDQNLIKK